MVDHSGSNRAATSQLHDGSGDGVPQTQALIHSGHPTNNRVTLSDGTQEQARRTFLPGAEYWGPEDLNQHEMTEEQQAENQLNLENHQATTLFRDAQQLNLPVAGTLLPNGNRATHGFFIGFHENHRRANPQYTALHPGVEENWRNYRETPPEPTCIADIDPILLRDDMQGLYKQSLCECSTRQIAYDPMFGHPLRY